MRIAIVHNKVTEADGPDGRDVLAQVDTVAEALTSCGHQALRRECTLDLAAIKRQLMHDQPDLAFNLVESLDGSGRLIALFPFVLDAMGLSYTGSSAMAILTTSDKVSAKQRMIAAGLPTPPWVTGDGMVHGLSSKHQALPSLWIVKSVWEHASVGIDEDSIIKTASLAALCAAIHNRSALLGGSAFAEAFVVGREFNLSILGSGTNDPEVLPAAEIVFEGFGETKPKIVDYKAKWEEDSFEYINTPRRFASSSDDKTLVATLEELALASWWTFALGGYARVDFRVDGEGTPWILEINANPCLSPDAGFAAACAQAGISMRHAVARILEDAASRCAA